MRNHSVTLTGHTEFREDLTTPSPKCFPLYEQVAVKYELLIMQLVAAVVIRLFPATELVRHNPRISHRRQVRNFQLTKEDLDEEVEEYIIWLE
jgi:hypothetical protein